MNVNNWDLSRNIVILAIIVMVLTSCEPSENVQSLEQRIEELEIINEESESELTQSKLIMSELEVQVENLISQLSAIIDEKDELEGEFQSKLTEREEIINDLNRRLAIGDRIDDLVKYEEAGQFDIHYRLEAPTNEIYTFRTEDFEFEFPILWNDKVMIRSYLGGSSYHFDYISKFSDQLAPLFTLTVVSYDSYLNYEKEDDEFFYVEDGKENVIMIIFPIDSHIVLEDEYEKQTVNLELEAIRLSYQEIIGRINIVN